MAEPSAPPRGVAGVGLSLDHAADSLGELGPALDRFERLGLDSVEIFLPAMAVVLGGRVAPGRLRELRRLCADRPFGITFHGPLSSDLGDRANATLQRDTVRAGIEAAGACGGSLYVLHAAVVADADPSTVESALAAERDGLAALAPLAAAAGVTIGVETMFAREGEWTASPAELARQIEAVGHPAIGAVIDFGHTYLNAALRGFDPVAEIAALAPHARHLHLHDNFARPPRFRPWTRGDAMSFGFGDLHLPPGLGALPWDALSAIPYAGPGVANLELDARWEPDWPAAIAWTRGWLDRIPLPAAA